MKTETEKDIIEMRKSTSVYNPHYTIERNGETICNVYEDAFNSPAQCHNVATTILLKLQNIFQQ